MFYGNGFVEFVSPKVSVLQWFLKKLGHHMSCFGNDIKTFVTISQATLTVLNNVCHHVSYYGDGFEYYTPYVILR